MTAEEHIIALFVIPIAGVTIGIVFSLAYFAWSDRKQKRFDQKDKKNDQ